ncbi:hypothetical protein FDC62_12905 [Clostridium botulinum]|uniref:GIY-YIG nuclease family protein n=1 Tax=Clostridium botulinum TaxID=1491 RepID=UPI00099231C4|nr:GIY-YIG nuclease family protein [Clostridium botulinum]NFO99068.1 hypothetical protein [Clostridium botulinum]OOV52390.1 hypothetical protein B1A66_04235 [Clostridium botulinum D/C]OOV55740.1 hypothetical protein B1A67_07800 [Clostridium botulinum D/C]OOV57187.1 hypothetical protein B0673_04880 [Clostridium botulinum D/C]
MIIYKITCKLNGKVYIGQTSETLQKRFKRHMGYQKNEHDTKFYRAIRKYGVENFAIEQIDTANTQEELDDKEMYWIEQYNAINKGYNSKSTKGKCGGDTLSNHPNKEAISQKIRMSKLGDNNPMRKYGGLKGQKNGMFGKSGSLNPNAKKVVVIDINTNEYLIFDSMTDVQKYTHITNKSMISSRCKGRTKSPYKHYKFQYYSDFIKLKGVETIETTSCNDGRE